MDEPSVLDYLKSRLFFWRGEKIQIPPETTPTSETLENEEEFYVESLVSNEVRVSVSDVQIKRDRLFSPQLAGSLWRVLILVSLGLLAQKTLEPPGRSIISGVILYLVAISFLAWGVANGEWALARDVKSEKHIDPFTIRPLGFWLLIPLIIITFFSFGNNQFSKGNVFVWLLSFLAFLYAFWLTDENGSQRIKQITAVFKNLFSKGVQLSPSVLLFQTCPSPPAAYINIESFDAE